MNKEQSEKIKRAIDRTSIPEEMIALYMLANATDMMCHNVFGRIKNVYRTNGLSINDDGSLAGLRAYCEKVRQAVLVFQDKIEPRIADSTYGTMGAREYEQFQDDCREICQLMLRYIDKTAKNRENALAVFNSIKALPGRGMFTEKDIERYG